MIFCSDSVAEDERARQEVMVVTKDNAVVKVVLRNGGRRVRHDGEYRD